MNILKYSTYAVLISLPIICRAIVRRYFERKFKELDEEDSYYYEQIFVTFDNFKCTRHIRNERACGASCSFTYLTKIVQFLHSAKHTVSICMYLLTNYEVRFALLKAHGRGLRVRYIADKTMAQCTGSQIPHLIKAGIPIKTPASDDMMHHKFCLIDEYHSTGKVMFGSTNLSCQALSANWDNILFTNNVGIVKRFSNEFEYLWNQFAVFKCS